MQIKVKKRVLFNLLKRHLNENRTLDNPSGNFVFPLNIEDDLPIDPSEHMAGIGSQYTEDAPPVYDEDYAPVTVSELRRAAARIAEEVPASQIRFFYDRLHKLLDDSLDNDDETNYMLSEAVRVLKEAMTYSDLDAYQSMFVDNAIEKSDYPDALDIAMDLLSSHDTGDYFEGIDEDVLVDIITDKIEGVSGPSKLASFQEEPPKPKLKKSLVKKRKKKPTVKSPSALPVLGPSLDIPEDIIDVASTRSYETSENKVDWAEGYSMGHDVALGGPAPDPKAFFLNKSIDFRDGYVLGYNDSAGAQEDFNIPEPERGEYFDPPSLNKPESGDYFKIIYSGADEALGVLPPASVMADKMDDYTDTEKFNLIYMYTVSNLQAISAKIASEHAKGIGNTDHVEDPEIVRLSEVYGLTNDINFSVNAMRHKSKMNLSTMQKAIAKFISAHAGKNGDRGYRSMLNKFAAANNIKSKRAIAMLTNLIASDFDNHRTQAETIAGDDYLMSYAKRMFTIISKSEPFNYANISLFMKKADPDDLEVMLDVALEDIEDYKSGGNYNLRLDNQKATYSVIETEEAIRSYFKKMFKDAEANQALRKTKEIMEIETEIEDAEGEGDEEIEEYIDLSTVTDFETLAPFFDFSGSSGLRQWYLKFPLRKMRMFNVSIASANGKGFRDLYFETTEDLLGSLSDPIVELAKDYTGKKDAASHTLVRAADQIKKANDAWLKSGEVEGLNTLGGQLVRIINGAAYHKVMGAFDRDWTAKIALEIKARSPNADDKSANSLAEFWTGKKEKPDFGKMTKAAKKLLAAGIGPEVYLEIDEASKKWFEKAVTVDFGTKNLGGGKMYVGSYRQKVLAYIKSILKNKNTVKKAIIKAINELIKESGARQAFKKYAGHEVIE